MEARAGKSTCGFATGSGERPVNGLREASGLGGSGGGVSPGSAEGLASLESGLPEAFSESRKDLAEGDRTGASGSASEGLAEPAASGLADRSDRLGDSSVRDPTRSPGDPGASPAAREAAERTETRSRGDSKRSPMTCWAARPMVSSIFPPRAIAARVPGRCGVFSALPAVKRRGDDGPDLRANWRGLRPTPAGALAHRGSNGGAGAGAEIRRGLPEARPAPAADA